MKTGNDELKVTLVLNVPGDSKLMVGAGMDSPCRRVEEVVRGEILSWLTDLEVDVTNIEIKKITRKKYNKARNIR